MKIDIGCGREPKEGFIGVDIEKFPEVQIVLDAGKQRWPWKDNSVEEVWCSHVVEHLTAKERIHFVNELYRVLKPGAFATIVTPYWSSSRAYGDLTHQWPPVVEDWYKYLDKQWRSYYTPHSHGYTCDFYTEVKYALNPMNPKTTDVNGIEDMAAIITKLVD